MRDIVLTLLKWIRPFTLLRWAVYVCAAGVIWLIFDFPLLQQYFQARERRNEYRQQVVQDEKRQAQLKLEHDALQHGGFSAEKTIRDRYHMKRPGEKVITLATPAPSPTQAGESP